MLPTENLNEKVDMINVLFKNGDHGFNINPNILINSKKKNN